MNHEELEELIHPYVDGELDIVSAREVQQHLGECEPCRAHERRVRALSGALRESAPAYRAPSRLRKRPGMSGFAVSPACLHNAGGWHEPEARASPPRISWAAETRAWKPDPQSRFTVSAGTVTGRPARKPTCRAQ